MTWQQAPRNQVGSFPFYCKGLCLVGPVCISVIWVSWGQLALLLGCALCLSSPCHNASRSVVTVCIQIRSPALWSPGWTNNVVSILDYLKQNGVEGRKENLRVTLLRYERKMSTRARGCVGERPHCCPSSSWCPTLQKEMSSQRNPTQDLVCTRREKPITCPQRPTN